MRHTSIVIIGCSIDHLKRPITPLNEDLAHMKDENVTSNLALNHANDENITQVPLLNVYKNQRLLDDSALFHYWENVATFHIIKLPCCRILLPNEMVATFLF